MTSPPHPSRPDLAALLAEDAWLRRLARVLVADESRADDLVQDTWTAALRHPPTDTGRPRAWLGTVIRNLARRGHRTDERVRRREQAAARPERVDSSPVAALERAELRRNVVNAVMELPEDFRVVIVLRWFEGLSVAEVAERVELTEAGVRTRLRRALERLRARLDDEHRGERAAWALPLAAWVGVDPSLPHGGAEAGVATGTAAIPVVGGLLMTVKSQVAMVGAVLLLAALAVVGSGVLESEPAEQGPVAEVDQRTTDEAPTTPDSGSPRRGPERTTASPPTDTADAEEVVDRDTDLHGVVLLADGSPAIDAAVVVLGREYRRLWLPGREEADSPSEIAGTTTADDGSFRVVLAPGDHVDLSVVHGSRPPHQVLGVSAGERVEVVLTDGVRVSVLVQDTRERPVASGVVEIVCSGDRGPVHRARATTDEDGIAEFEGVPPGRRTSVRAAHPDYAATAFAFHVSPDRGDARWTFVLPPGRRVSGSVQAADGGAPIEGASVGTAVRPGLTETDGRGIFTLPAVGAGDGRLRVTARGFAPAEVDLAPTVDLLTIALEPERRLTGRVVSPDGEAVADAQVAAIGWRRGTNGFPAERSSAHATTNADGTFEVGGLSRTTPLTLVLVADGHGRTLVDLPAGDDQELGDLTLQPARTLTVHLRQTDGLALDRVTIELVGANDDRAARVPDGRISVPVSIGATESRSTDDLGRARFAGLSPGTYALTARLPGQESVERVVELTEDTALDWEIEVSRSVVVVVVDEQGLPVSGAMVRVRDAAGAVVHGTSGRDGRVVLLPEQATAQIEVRPVEEGAFLPHHWAPFESLAGEQTVEIQAGERFLGRLVDPEDSPVSGVNLTLVEQPGGTKRTVLTGDDGRFEVRVSAGVQVEVLLDGLGRTSLEEIQRGVTQKELAWEGRWTGLAPRDTAHTLRVTPLSRAALRVRVLTPDGAPVPGVRVLTRLGHWMGVGPDVRTDAEGRATIPDLPRRPRRLVVDLEGVDLGGAPWIEPAERTVTSGGDEIDVRLRRALAIRGKVVLADGSPATWCGVEALTPGEAADGGARQIASATSEGDGSFTLLVPEDAPGALVVVARTYTRERERLEGRVADVAPGAEDVVIRVE